MELAHHRQAARDAQLGAVADLSSLTTPTMSSPTTSSLGHSAALRLREKSQPGVAAIRRQPSSRASSGRSFGAS